MNLLHRECIRFPFETESLRHIYLSEFILHRVKFHKIIDVIRAVYLLLPVHLKENLRVIVRDSETERRAFFTFETVSSSHDLWCIFYEQSK